MTIGAELAVCGQSRQTFLFQATFCDQIVQDGWFEKEVADAHPNGLRPFKRSDYIKKFETLTNGLITQKESKRFLKTVQNLKFLKPKDLNQLNIEIKSKKIKSKNKHFIF